MRLITALTILIGMATSHAFASDTKIELLNSTLIAKLHLDPTARKGQMVGAYQVSFRNISDSPLSNLTLLLNPSLVFTHAVGPNNIPLSISSDVTAVAGYELLELNRATVRLPKPLEAGRRTEIVVHYKGYLTNMTFMAVEGVKETLNPDFTMIRADSFGYPVFAEPSQSSIATAFAHKPFQQVVFLDYPGNNNIAGSLGAASKSLNGNVNTVQMKSTFPTGLFAAAIAPYSQLEAGPVTISYLDGGLANGQSFQALAVQEIQQLNRLLGTPSAGAELHFVEIPAGYSNSDTKGAFFRERGFFDATAIPADIKIAIFDLWKTIGGGAPGHWSNGLDAFIQAAITRPESIVEFQQMNFKASQQLFKTNKKMGKTSLADYAIEGFSAQSDAVSTLAYATLYSLLEHEAFFKFVKDLRQETRGKYTDTEVIAEFLKGNIKDKTAKKFARNWFSSGRAGKDMAKAKSFEELLKRYK